MNPCDFVFNQIYKGAMRQGATEKAARYHAGEGLADYNKSKMPNKASGLIEQRIISAKKMKSK